MVIPPSFPMCVRHTVFPVPGAPQIHRAPGCCLVVELHRKLEIAPNFASLQSMGEWCSGVVLCQPWR